MRRLDVLEGASETSVGLGRPTVFQRVLTADYTFITSVSVVVSTLLVYDGRYFIRASSRPTISLMSFVFIVNWINYPVVYGRAYLDDDNRCGIRRPLISF